MKKVLFFILTLFLSIEVVNASSIDTIDMDINLDQNGTATVKETWKATVTEGTEGWHPYYNLGNSTINVLSASMDGKSYNVESYWNEGDSLNGKAYKAGIYNANGNEVDVVFGISEYGTHTYEVIYQITNFVSNVEDADMIYWQLFPYDFSAQPNNVTIKISGPYEYPDTLEVWGYGMAGAPCYVQNGSIYMTSDGRISKSEYLTLLAKFPAGTFNTTSKLNNDFEHYLNMANEGATSYVEPGKNFTDNWFFKILSFLFSIGAVLVNFTIAAFVIGLGVKSYRQSQVNYDFGVEGKSLPKDVNNFREIPCDKDIYRAFFIADLYNLNKSKNDFMGVLLLKWIRDGNVYVETITHKKLFKTKYSDVIVFDHAPETNNANELNLYNYMKEASGDNKLEKDEFKKWCNNHYSTILDWSDKVLNAERRKLVLHGSLTDTVTQAGAIFKYDVHKYTITPVIRNDAIELKGLKKFLTEFSQIDKKEPIEVKLWDEYLMYAQIFGIADQVMKKFKDLYPEIVSEMENYNFNYNTFVFLNAVSSSGISAASSARSAAESYSSGGGGFSSGGGGGGSFGGGGGGGGFR